MKRLLNSYKLLYKIIIIYFYAVTIYSIVLIIASLLDFPFNDVDGNYHLFRAIYISVSGTVRVWLRSLFAVIVIDLLLKIKLNTDSENKNN